jgi:hypothetical protein
VVGRVAAAFDDQHLNAANFPGLLVGAAPQGDHGLVFRQQQLVADGSGDALIDKL